MGRPSVFVVITIFLAHLISFSLALGAEQRRTTVSWQYDPNNGYYYCHYKLDIASGLAAAAFVFNLLSFLLIMGMTKCYCCAGPHKPSGSRFCAIFSFFLLIPAFIIAQACLLAGVSRNQMHTKAIYFQGQTVPDCDAISKGIFTAGAAFTFFCLILSLSYYVSASKSEDGFPSVPRPPAVGMTMFPHPPMPGPYSL